ncbi:MAG TPA: DUF2269 family protein [Acidimicrobiia bacterium]|jgi:uncharacterized membrane protein
MTSVGYQTLLAVHILAGMAWLGGGLVIQITGVRAFRLGGRPAVDRVRRDVSWADTWLAVPAPLLVVGTGLAMVTVNTGWRFAQAWIWTSIAIVGAYQTLAVTLGVRLYRQQETGQGDQPTRSVLRLGNVLLALLTGNVLLMVFKPGVG